MITNFSLSITVDHMCWLCSPDLYCERRELWMLKTQGTSSILWTQECLTPLPEKCVDLLKVILFSVCLTFCLYHKSIFDWLQFSFDWPFRVGSAIVRRWEQIVNLCEFIQLINFAKYNIEFLFWHLKFFYEFHTIWRVKDQEKENAGNFIILGKHFVILPCSFFYVHFSCSRDCTVIV